MNIQNKALLIVILIIISMASGYSYYLYYVESKYLNSFQQRAKKQLSQQYHHYTQIMLDQRYHYELLALLNNPKVINSIQKRDRDALLSAIKPAWELLRSENSYISRVHFHLPDGTSFLRVHMPNKYGDHISSLRPMLREIHREQKPLTGVEIGQHGLFFRVIEPIQKDGQYIGAVELGLSMEYVLRMLEEMYQITSFLLIRDLNDKEKIKRWTESGSYQTFGNHAIRTVSTVEKQLQENVIQYVDSKHKSNIVKHNEKTYLLHSHLQIPTVKGSPEILLIVAQDISSQINKRELLFWRAIISTIVIILIIYITLQLTLTPLLKKLEQVNRKLQEKVAEITELSITDSLTGITNRKHFNNIFAQELSRSKRYGTALSLIIFDIDFFKKINDTYGHPIGDLVLVKLTEVINNHIRETDVFSRWGGEEFMIILPNQTQEQSEKTAKKLCATINSTEFNPVGKISISCGVTQLRESDDMNSILNRVDKNLYQAKSSGRNRAVVY